MLMKDKKMKDFNYRRKFFKKFMSLFVGHKLKITKETSKYIKGILTWPDYKDSQEEVRWDMSLNSTPTDNCLKLITYLKTKNIIEIDQISIPKKKLYKQFTFETKNDWKYKQFESALNELKNITVVRIREGKEFDDFYIHE